MLTILFWAAMLVMIIMLGKLIWWGLRFIFDLLYSIWYGVTYCIGFILGVLLARLAPQK